ncbi:MAG: hypothetical protein WD077_06010 [Bacteroidia bacterium]
MITGLHSIICRLATLICFALFLFSDLDVYAQGCGSSTPVLLVDLRGNPDGVWVSAPISRSGYCCGVGGNNRCIKFFVQLDSMAGGVILDIAGGSGSTYYSLGCSTSTTVGTMNCISQGGLHELTVCKPGGNAQTYIITSISRPHAVTPVYLTPTCVAELNTEGLVTSSINWDAVGNPAFNNNLSCTTGCNTSYMTYSQNLPDTVIYEICGNSTSPCLPGIYCDTMVVVMLEANAGNDTTICESSNYVNLNGSIRGPSNGKWLNGTGRFHPNDSALDATYIPSKAEVTAGFVDLVLKTDSLGEECGAHYDTVHITIVQAPEPIVTGSDLVCENEDSVVYSTQNVPGYSYEWTVLGGNITSGQNTSEIAVEWGDEGAGFVYVTVINSGGCSAVASISPLVHYDFNFAELGAATNGPDATNVNPDAGGTGIGATVLDNCGAGTGLDITVNGNIFNYGRLAMFFRFQRDESNADFFERGAFKFNIAGNLMVEMEVIDTNGNTTSTGPINTGYNVPVDDVFRNYAMLYDSASGEVTLYVDDAEMWTHNLGRNKSLNWSSAGDGIIGGFMDGDCSKKAFIDFANISLPVTIKKTPDPSTIVGGPSNICERSGNYFYHVPYTSGHTYNWSVSGGSIISGANTDSALVYWADVDTGVITITETSVSGCSVSSNKKVPLIRRPVPEVNGPDSVCKNSPGIFYNATSTSNNYNWSVTGGTIVHQSSNNITVDWGAGDTGIITLTEMNNHCDSTINFLVIINPVPDPDIIGDTIICINNSGNVYSTPVTVGSTYSWSISGGNFISGNTGPSVNANWTAVGANTISLTETVTQTGCSHTTVLNVTVHPAVSTSDIKY